MTYAVLAPSGIVTRVLKVDTVPDGWIESTENVPIGSTYADGVFTPPPPPPPPTPEELEQVVQDLADDITQTGDRDKAMAMLIADVIAKAFDIPTAEARQMVRDRLVTHLRTLKGI